MGFQERHPVLWDLGWVLSLFWVYFSPKKSADIGSDLPQTKRCFSIPLQGKSHFPDCIFEENMRKTLPLSLQ